VTEEQTGTAAPAEGAPEPAAQVEGQPAQPEAIERPVESAKPTINWDDPTNPWRSRFDGLQGNFKQTQTELKQMKTVLQQIQAERDAEQRRRQEEASERGLDEFLEKPDEEVASEVRTRRQLEKALSQRLQQVAPTLKQQAYRELHQQYETGLTALAEEQGVTHEELAEIATAHQSDFAGFVKALFTKGVEKKVVDVDARIQRAIQENTKALRTELTATQRGQQPSPDTGGGEVTHTFRNVDDVHTAYVNGELGNPHSRAAGEKYTKELARFGATP